FRLHQLPRQEIISRWQTRSDRMPPGRTLYGSEPQACNLRGERIHADIGEDQDVQPIRKDLPANCFEVIHSVAEVITVLPKAFGHKVGPFASVVTENLKSVSVVKTKPTQSCFTD